MRKRIGKKGFEEHPRQILGKTQTALYMEFWKEHAIRCSQTTFESQKLYYVKTATKSDRNSCLHMKHVEIHKIFKDFVKLRKPCCIKQLPIYSRPIENTLCLTDKIS